MRKFTNVPDFDNARRMPLLGKLRMGIKVQTKEGKTYPKETSYFVCPEEVEKIYGKEPTELEVYLPSSDRSLVFPRSRRRYGSTQGLKCIGDGINAYNLEEKTDIKCPCELAERDCKPVGFLFVILPRISLGGVYQIRTTSWNSVTDILSGMDYIEGLLNRPCNMIPMKLRRIKTETHFEKGKQTHYTLQLIFDGDVNKANEIIEKTKGIVSHIGQLALPSPDDINPEFDEGKTVIEAETKPDPDPPKNPESPLTNAENPAPPQTPKLNLEQPIQEEKISYGKLICEQLLSVNSNRTRLDDNDKYKIICEELNVKPEEISKLDLRKLNEADKKRCFDKLSTLNTRLRNEIK